MAIPTIVTRSFAPSLFERGLRQVYFQAFGDIAERQYTDVYAMRTSVKAQETDALIAGLGNYRLKPEGNRPDFDGAAQSYTVQYIMRTWALGMEITEEAREDELYGIIIKMAQEMARAARYTREVQAMDMLNNPTSTIYTADGTAYGLQSTTHFRKDGGTWSNTFTVMKDLNVNTLQEALTQYRTGMLNQRGQKSMVKPKYLAVAPGNWWNACELLESQLKPGTNLNDTNVVRTKAQLQPLLLDHLTDDGRWLLLDDNGAMCGRLYFNRRPDRFRRETQYETGNEVYVGSYRERHGATHPTGTFISA